MGVRRLPFVPELQPDEAFASFLDRTAMALEVTRVIVLQATGVVARTDIHPIAFGVDLTAEAFRNVEQATGIGRERIEASLLRRFASTGVDMTGLDLDAPSSVRSWSMRTWAYVQRSNCCPGCVSERGTWQVHWRTAWQFLCDRHRTFLVDVCPRCGKALYANVKQAGQVTTCCGPAATYAELRADGHPRVRRTGRDLCGQPVVEIPARTASDDRLVELQRRLLGLLDAAPAESDVARATLSEIQSCTTMVRYLAPRSLFQDADPVVRERFEAHCGERDDPSPRKGVTGPAYRAYGLTPRDPLLVAASVWGVSDMVLGDDPAGAADRFVDETYRDRVLRERWTQLDKFWSPPDRLKPFIERARDRRIYAVAANLDGRSRRSSRLRHSSLSWRNVPQLLWEPWYDEVAPVLFDKGWRDHQRRFLSLALARQLSPELSNWATAAETLGLPGEISANAHRLSSMLRQSRTGGRLEEFLGRIVSAMEAMPEPIDYATRRTGLADLDDLDAVDWFHIVTSTGRKTVNRHWEGRRPAAAAWVWVTATGGDFHFAPSMRISELPVAERGLAENRYRQYFVGSALPEVETELRRLANELLRTRDLPGPLQSPLDFRPVVTGPQIA